MNNVYLHGRSIAVLLLVAMVVTVFVHKVRRVQRRKTLEQVRESNQAGQALVRYVQLNRQCSQDVAYQRLARFVKHYVPFDDHSYIDRMVAHDRQSLLERARSLLAYHPDEIDRI